MSKSLLFNKPSTNQMDSKYTMDVLLGSLIFGAYIVEFKGFVL